MICRNTVRGLPALVLLAGLSSGRAAPPATVSIQGQLRTATGQPVTSPAGGTTVVFALYAAPSGGTPVWTETQSVRATGGLFSVSLGAVTPLTLTFDKPFWLGVKIVGETAEMTPRLPLQSVPYALGAWGIAGNGGTNPTAHFLGTTDARPLLLKANNQRGLLLEDRQNAAGIRSVNVLAGSPLNSIAAGVVGATIAGGGSSAAGSSAINDVRGDFGVIGGGNGNFADAAANIVIAGGSGNIGQGAFSVISGGASNNTQGDYSTIAGGQSSFVASSHGTVAGGNGNTVSGTAGAIGGGAGNTANGNASSIGGGTGNTANGNVSSIGGGDGNQASGNESTIAGGFQNAASGWRSVVGGGAVNTVSEQASTIGGGQANSVEGWFSTIAGGQANLIPKTPGSLNGGAYGTIGGGYGNTVRGWYGMIGGGEKNQVNAYADYGTIGGGSNNVALDAFATVPGGYHNVAAGKASLAAGYRANAIYQGSFVWSDASSDAEFYSPTTNQFAIRAQHGIVLETGANPGFYTGTGGVELNRYLMLLNSYNSPSASGLMAGGILCSDDYGFSKPDKNSLVVKGAVAVGTASANGRQLWVNGLAGGTSNWNAASDARLKADVRTLPDALDTVLRLRGVSFDWRGQDYPALRLPEGRHIGFIAQEVEKVLPEVVSTDADGMKAVSYGDVVPLLTEAVKTLKEQNDELAARNKALEDKVDALTRAVEQIQAASR